MSGRLLGAQATVALVAALRDVHRVSRVFVAERDGSIIIELSEAAEEIEAYKADVNELMRMVIAALGSEARGRSLQGAPVATIGPAIRGATLLYEREAV